jgi:hypothetical protein
MLLRVVLRTSSDFAALPHPLSRDDHDYYRIHVLSGVGASQSTSHALLVTWHKVVLLLKALLTVGLVLLWRKLQEKHQ